MHRTEPGGDRAARRRVKSNTPFLSMVNSSTCLGRGGVRHSPRLTPQSACMETRRYLYMLLVLCFILTSFICVKMRHLMPVDNRAPYLRTYLEGGGSSWEAEDSTEVEEQILSWKPVPSCSFRNIVKQDRNLRKRFNFSVPLLQWAESFNQSEWQRLQYAPLPFGWQELSPNVVRNTLSLLHDSASSRLFERENSSHCVRCAVVGNGGILKGSGQGKAIDSHDYVFRMNGAITKHFEEDVGTKTSFYGFTTNTMKNSLKAYWTDGFTMVPQYPIFYGLRSGDCLGHTRTLMCFFLSYSFVALAVCFGSLSRWKTCPQPIFSVLSEARRLSFKILKYMTPFISPSMQ